MERVASILVLMICCIALVPPLVNDVGYASVVDSPYFKSLYWIFSYASLSLITALIPLQWTKLYIGIRHISILTSGWFFSALIFKLMTFGSEADVSDQSMYFKHLTCFTVGVASIILYNHIYPNGSKH